MEFGIACRREASKANDGARELVAAGALDTGEAPQKKWSA
jgi:hypothetical protein